VLAPLWLFSHFKIVSRRNRRIKNAHEGLFEYPAGW